jgi:hypothetical protein
MAALGKKWVPMARIFAPGAAADTATHILIASALIFIRQLGGVTEAPVNVRLAPCVGGAPLARTFLMFCPSIGMAMSAVCSRGT